MAYPSGTSAQRIRIGLTGLAFAFLLVLLGSVITRSRDDGSAIENTQLNKGDGDEPLAQLGVAPGGDASLNNASEK